MELTSDDISMIEKHLEAAAACGFTKMVFFQHQAFGISDNHSACMISPCELSIPKTVSIGIPALGDFIKRFNAYKGAPSVSLELKADQKTKTITFKTGKSKMTYRCADHTKINYPKSVSDQVIGELVISKDEASELKKAISIMTAPQYVNVSISSRGECRMSFYDQTNDEFEIHLDRPFTSITDDDRITYHQKFDCKGPFISVMYEIMRSAGEVHYQVTESGNLRVEFKDVVEIYLIPSITSED